MGLQQNKLEKIQKKSMKEKQKSSSVFDVKDLLQYCD